MPPLRVIPLGGLGDIGKNMLVLEYGDDMIAVDAGVMFPKHDMLGIDLVIPDISYILERREKFRGIVITHGHEDHIGALPYVLEQINVPVYASRLTKGLISVKLREARLLDSTNLNEVAPEDIIDLGAFSIEFFRVCHSIPDAMGLAIRTPVGTVVHTGDFKFDHTPVDGRRSDLAKLARIGDEGVHLLLSDSTYAELPGFTPSEQVVGETLDQVIGQAEGRVIVTTFASLISRIQQVVRAAVKHQRRIAIVGRSMVNNVNIATKLGYLDVPNGALIKPRELPKTPSEDTVVITTGAQGEPTSALTRMANGDHKEIVIMPGDTVVISATPIPGNDVLVNRTIDNLMRLGARVVYNKLRPVHVHGHAAQEELKAMINLIRPRYFVPIHGEYRHMTFHADLAQSMAIPRENIFIMEDGDVLELTNSRAIRSRPVVAGPVYIDGTARWDMRSLVLRDRKVLSKDGVVTVLLVIDRKTRRIAGNPEVVSYGFLQKEEEAEVMSPVREIILKALDQSKAGARESSDINSAVKESLSKYFFERTKRKPIILPMSTEV